MDCSDEGALSLMMRSFAHAAHDSVGTHSMAMRRSTTHVVRQNAVFWTIIQLITHKVLTSTLTCASFGARSRNSASREAPTTDLMDVGMSAWCEVSK